MLKLFPITPQFSHNMAVNYPHLILANEDIVCKKGFSCIDNKLKANMKEYSTTEDIGHGWRQIIAIRKMCADSCANCPFTRGERAV